MTKTSQTIYASLVLCSSFVFLFSKITIKLETIKLVFTFFVKKKNFKSFTFVFVATDGSSAVLLCPFFTDSSSAQRTNTECWILVSLVGFFKCRFESIFDPITMGIIDKIFLAPESEYGPKTCPKPPPGVHYPPGAVIRDYKVYKLENAPELMEVQRKLSARGLHSPWLRFVFSFIGYSPLLRCWNWSLYFSPHPEMKSGDTNAKTGAPKHGVVRDKSHWAGNMPYHCWSSPQSMNLGWRKTIMDMATVTNTAMDIENTRTFLLICN